MNWKVGDAKQRLSELIRQSEAEPQLVYSRDRFVAAVISAELYEQFEQWCREREERTLGQRFQEIREVCREDDYTLETGERRDRDSWVSDGS